MNNASFKVTPTCKWCCSSPSVTTFEDAVLCKDCYTKAVHAAEHPKLCSRCINLLTKRSTIGELFSEHGLEHSSAGYLRKSSEDGCGMCRMMWLQDPNGEEMRLEFTLLCLRAERPEGIGEEGNKTDEVGDINLLHFSSEGLFRLDMPVSALPNDPAARFITQRPPEEDLGNERTNSLIRDWLDECLKTHPESLSNELPLLPTRVIDVGVGIDPQVVLLEAPRDFRARYITLSYCWGKARFLATIKGNLDERKRKLEVDSLPQTYKDAITTTRNLGFRYLWIDALCIIQDESEDKIKEIENMGNVYSDSTLTISVVGATAVADGFLKPKARRFIELPYRCPDGIIGSVRVSARRDFDLRDEPLYTRAWCLQENLLSPRNVLYTDTEVVWQCQTCPVKRLQTSHVSYANENPNFSSSPFRRLPANVLNPIFEVGNAEDAPSDAERYQIWRSVVENYTRRNLTVASDRLPALAGIAQKFRASWNDNYIAGIWERQLLPSLSWRRSTEQDQPHYPALAEYRAPSWSWASIDGPVKFDVRFDLGNARGMQARIKSWSFDLSTEKRDAIVIEGYMIPISHSFSPNEKQQIHLYLDDHPDDGRWPRMADRIESFNDEMKAICWLLLLGEGRDGSKKMMTTTALVLGQIPGEDGDTFGRIGFWKLTEKGASKHWMQKSRRVIKIV